MPAPIGWSLPILAMSISPSLNRAAPGPEAQEVLYL